MKAARIVAPGQLEVIDVPPPEADPGEVVIEVAFAGICGSDVEMFAGNRPPDFVQYPIVPGHEWAGTVVEAGPEVDEALVGRKVVGEGFRGCMACDPCRRGEATLCESVYDEVGFTRQGAWAERLVLPSTLVHVLPDDADLRSAAGLEPSACAAEAVRGAALSAGDSVAIVGGGSIGLLVLQLVRATRPREVVVVEPDEERAALAREMGATDAVSVDAALAYRDRFDAVIEAAGVDSSAQLSIDLVRRGGRVVLAGLPGGTASMSVSDVVSKRATIATVFGADRPAWDHAVAAFTDGFLDPGLLVTHEFGLDSVNEALELVASRSRSVGKVLVRPEPGS